MSCLITAAAIATPSRVLITSRSRDQICLLLAAIRTFKNAHFARAFGAEVRQPLRLMPLNFSSQQLLILAKRGLLLFVEGFLVGVAHTGHPRSDLDF